MTTRIILERTFDASLAQVWELIATREGLESWWGPEGFVTRVLELDLRPGGKWRYAMTATGAAQVEFMKQAKMPLTTETRAVFTEVLPRRRLGYRNHVDFVPGLKPYEMSEAIELHPAGRRGVRMVVTLDVMHDERWTKMSQLGWEQQLAKLAAVLQAA